MIYDSGIDHAAPERLIYVETTSYVSDDLVVPVQPTVSLEAMAALTAELAGIKRADLTDDEQRQLDQRISEYLDPKAPATAATVIADMPRRAESLTRWLGLTLVASGSRVTKDDPICSAARGWAIGPAWFTSYAQGFALATWEPVTYPGNGDWSPGPGIGAWLSFYDTDVPPREAPDLLTLDDPLADLQLWAGVTTERADLSRMLTGPDGRPAPWRWADLPMAIEQLQYRRNSQAGGRPLWTTPKILPEPLRDGDWTMFACHVRETARIPAANLEALTARSARAAQ